MTLPDFLAEDKYGYIHLAGHRIGLKHVVDLYSEGYSPEMVLDHYPTLSLALIHKVIALYLENRTEINAYIAKARQEMERLENSCERGPDLAELRRRMAAVLRQ